MHVGRQSTKIEIAFFQILVPFSCLFQVEIGFPRAHAPESIRESTREWYFLSFNMSRQQGTSRSNRQKRAASTGVVSDFEVNIDLTSALTDPGAVSAQIEATVTELSNVTLDQENPDADYINETLGPSLQSRESILECFEYDFALTLFLEPIFTSELTAVPDSSLEYPHFECRLDSCTVTFDQICSSATCRVLRSIGIVGDFNCAQSLRTNIHTSPAAPGPCCCCCCCCCCCTTNRYSLSRSRPCVAELEAMSNLSQTLCESDPTVCPQTDNCVSDPDKGTENPLTSITEQLCSCVHFMFH